MIESDSKNGEISPLLMALGAALNTEIKLVVNCKIRSKKKVLSEDPFKSVIILLAKTGVYLFKKDLLHVKFHFEYKNVKNVKLEYSNPNSLMIQLDDVFMDKSSVPHIYISLPDRDLFLNTFSCYYSTYYANYIHEVKDLKIIKVDVIEFENDVPLDDKYKVVYNQPPVNYKLKKHRNYSFFLPSIFQEVGDLIYNFKIPHRVVNNQPKENDQENLNVSQNNISKEILPNNDDKSFIEKELECEFVVKMQLDKNLQTSNSQNNMLRLEINTYSEFINYVKKSYKMCKLFIYKDCPYIRKYSLSEDSSYWECWQMEALMIAGSIKKKLVFFNLRRKYIPPFFDALSDFTFLCMVNCNELDDSQFIDLKISHPKLYEMIESVVDSVHPDVVPNYKEFSTILEMKFDSLSLDYHSFMYYTQNLKIYGPETYHIGLKFVLRLMEIIKSGDFKAIEQKLKFKTDKTKREEEFYYKLKYFEKVYEMLKKKIYNYLNSESFKEKKIDDG